MYIYDQVRGRRWSERMTSKHFEQLMKDNQQYVVKDKEAADKLLKQYVFTTMSRYGCL